MSYKIQLCCRPVLWLLDFLSALPTILNFQLLQKGYFYKLQLICKPPHVTKDMNPMESLSYHLKNHHQHNVTISIMQNYLQSCLICGLITGKTDHKDLLEMPKQNSANGSFRTTELSCRTLQ